MQITENWTDISGTVSGSTACGSRKRFRHITIEVSGVDDVAGFKSLIRSRPGGQVMVHVPTELVDRLAIETGMQIVCRVRMGSRRVLFVHRDHVKVLGKGSEPN